MGTISLILILLVPSQVAIPVFSTGGPSPRTLPYLVLYSILICSVGLILQSVVFKKDSILMLDFKSEKPLLIMVGLMLLFGVLMITVGFMVSIIVALPLMLYIMGERKPFIYCFVIIAGILIQYLFIEVFNIPLPVIGGRQWNMF